MHPEKINQDVLLEKMNHCRGTVHRGSYELRIPSQLQSVCNPILRRSPERLSGTEPWPCKPGAVYPSLALIYAHFLHRLSKYKIMAWHCGRLYFVIVCGTSTLLDKYLQTLLFQVMVEWHKIHVRTCI